MSDEADASAPSRRAILSGSGLAATGVAARALAKDSRAAPGAPLVINALGGLENPNLDGDGLNIDDRAIADAKAAGLTAVNVTVGYVSGPAEPFAATIESLAAWDRVVRERAADLIKVTRAADISRARSEGRIGVILGFQNAVQLGDDLGRIATFGDLGVRAIQLTYNPANQIGDGCMAPLDRGLTNFGRRVIAGLEARRIMVDLSHSGERTCLDAIAVARGPISINHTGCRALNDLPRNKTDTELRGVADKGGFVGIYSMPFLSPTGHARAEDVVEHIDHAVNVCGEDHVGVGTDGSATAIDDLGAYQARLAKEVADRAAAGVGAKGERSDTYPFVVDLRGVDQFRKLEALLRARGYATTRIEKVLGLNFLAFAREVWGA